MTWQRMTPYYLQHEPTGARIAKCGYHTADGQLAHRYLLYGPDRAAGWSYRAWSNGTAPHWSGRDPKARTEIGESRPERRVFLGRFDSATEAQAAYADHLRNVTKMVGQDHVVDATNMVSQATTA